MTVTVDLDVKMSRCQDCHIESQEDTCFICGQEMASTVSWFETNRWLMHSGTYTAAHATREGIVL